MMPSFQKLAVQPMQANPQLAVQQNQGQQLPSYTPMQQPGFDDQNAVQQPQGSFQLRLQGNYHQFQPQKYYDQQQPQYGVTPWDMRYLVNPNANWVPSYNPADFNSPVIWGGNAAHQSPNKLNSLPTLPARGSRVYFNGTNPSLLDRLRSLL